MATEAMVWEWAPPLTYLPTWHQVPIRGATGCPPHPCIRQDLTHHPLKWYLNFCKFHFPNWVILESTWFLTRWQCDDPFLFVKRCRRFTPIKFQKRKFRFLRTAWRRPHPTTSRDGDWLAQMLVCLHVLVKPFIAHHLCTWTKKKNLSIVSRIGIHHADSQTKITSVW